MERANRKTAVITGASSGLGLAFTKLLRAQGYNIVMIARDKQKLADTHSMFPDDEALIKSYSIDVSQEHSWQANIIQLMQEVPTIDFLIINAGVVHPGALDEISVQQLEATLDTDLKGALLTAYHLNKLLASSSRVLVISSALGIVPMAGYGAYCAAKAGVINFAGSWRRELLERNVSVYVACPADIDTPQYRHELESMPPWMKLTGRKVSPAATIASTILKHCTGNKFLIIPNTEIKLYYHLARLLPLRILNYIFDRVLPRPRK